MNVKIQSVKFDADKKLIDFVESKLSKFERFIDKAVFCEVTLKIDKDDDKGNKVAVITIDVPNNRLVSEKKAKSFEEAVDLCVDALKKQLDRYKEKQA